jgi:hypothetical protein
MSIMGVLKSLKGMAGNATTVGGAAEGAANRGTTILINKLLGKKWNEGMAGATGGGSGEGSSAVKEVASAVAGAIGGGGGGQTAPAQNIGSQNIPTPEPVPVPAPQQAAPPAQQQPVPQQAMQQPMVAQGQGMAQMPGMGPNANRWGWGRPQGYQRPLTNSFGLPPR